MAAFIKGVFLQIKLLVVLVCFKIFRWKLLVRIEPVHVQFISCLDNGHIVTRKQLFPKFSMDSIVYFVSFIVWNNLLNIKRFLDYICHRYSEFYVALSGTFLIVRVPGL